MANSKFFILLIFTISSPAYANTLSPTPSSSPTTTALIESSCKTTQYPSLCISSLSPYASTLEQNPAAIACAATSVALSELQSLKSSLSTIHQPSAESSSSRKEMALKDCVDDVRDAADLTKSSLKELLRIADGGLSETVVEWKVSNAQTWMSAALTNEDTCTDGLKPELAGAGDPMEGVVKSVDKVKMFSCNALALINNLRH